VTGIEEHALHQTFGWDIKYAKTLYYSEQLSDYKIEIIPWWNKS